MNISTPNWPLMAVARAARHGRSNPGRMFCLSLTGAYGVELTQTILKGREVGRF